MPNRILHISDKRNMMNNMMTWASYLGDRTFYDAVSHEVSGPDGQLLIFLCYEHGGEKWEGYEIWDEIHLDDEVPEWIDFDSFIARIIFMGRKLYVMGELIYEW